MMERKPLNDLNGGEGAAERLEILVGGAAERARVTRIAAR